MYLGFCFSVGCRLFLPNFELQRVWILHLEFLVTILVPVKEEVECFPVLGKSSSCAVPDLERARTAQECHLHLFNVRGSGGKKVEAIL